MRIAVIGLAGVGGVHVAKVSDMESAELACVCDIVPDIARRVGEKYKVKSYTSAEEMFEREELVDCLINSLTNSGFVTSQPSA